MLKLVYSNRTEALAGAFVRDLTAFREAHGPLEPVTVVVPNRNVESWLRMELARRTGIAANLDVRYLRRFLRSLTGERADWRVVDGEGLEGMLLSFLLDDEALARPELAPVRAWLTAAGTGREAVDVRRHQLSVQLAHVFEEYGYSRPELLEAWKTRLVLQQTAGAEVERWQRATWLGLFGPGGLAERRRQATGVEWTPFSALFERLERRDAAPASVFLFGVSYVARFFHRVLATLARKGALHAYTLNPCREFWEDVRGAKSALSPGEDDPFRLEQADTPALRLWGRPGRENIRMLNALAECDFQEAFEDAPSVGATLLERLRQDILERAPERAEPAPDLFANDRSITFLRCPSVRREAETIATEIWRLVQEDEAAAAKSGREPLRFNDIAVLVGPAGRDDYYAQLSAAFAQAHVIPHSLEDLPFAASTRVAEAMALLLALPTGRFTRRELLDVLTHPLVAGRFPDASPEEWTAWCDGLGIVHGDGREAHEGTYIEADLLNWDQGVRRLALGAFLPGERSGVVEPFAVGRERYLPYEVGLAEADAAAELGLLVRSLLADARFARGAELTLPEWVAFLRALADAYLVPTSEGEANDLERWKSALSGLADRDLDGRRLSYPLARALATSALDQVATSRGQPLANGVVVSTFQPMRALPFRVVFLAGMGEGRFPAPVRKSQLDLRQIQRHPGDVSPREQDKYLFLETLLCTRERLYLSWMARQPLTGEALEPASVVVELGEMLERGYVGEEGLERLHRTIPLRRHEEASVDELFAEALPQAGREARTARLRDDCLARTGTGPPPADELRSRLDERSRSALFERLGLPPKPPSSARDSSAPLQLSLAALRAFLVCPLQAWARHRLRLGEEGEGDPADVADEPFALERLDESLLLASALVEGVGRAAGEGARLDLAAEYDRLALLGQLSGHHPLGVFASTARAKSLRSLADWRELLEREVGHGVLPASLDRVRFGRAEEHARIVRLEKAIVLDVDVDGATRRVELSGQTEPLLPDLSGSVQFERRALGTDWTETARRWRKGLRAFVDHAALAASGVSGTRPRRAHLCIADGDGRKAAASFEIAPFTTTEARAWLATLTADLLRGAHAYALPCEAIFEARLRDVPLEAAVASSFARRSFQASSVYGPVPHPERYPVPQDAEEIVERRFGPFFERFHALEEA